MVHEVSGQEEGVHGLADNAIVVHRGLGHLADGPQDAVVSVGAGQNGLQGGLGELLKGC